MNSVIATPTNMTNIATITLGINIRIGFMYGIGNDPEEPESKLKE
jgi:hypothetical protein